jgi:GTPase
MSPTQPDQRRSGFVSIIGRPNVGKSTLLNRLVGEKLAGVSPKPQTTRNTVRGILSRDEGQIVFFDTPGMHDPKDLLGSWMHREVDRALDGADILYWLVLPEPPHPYEETILKKIKSVSIPVFLLVNQIDHYAKEHMIPVLDYYNDVYRFKELIPISAKTGQQTELLLEKTFENLPLSPPLFPEDQISDQNERFIVSEMLREKMFHFTQEEIPYSTAVIIDTFKERNEKLIDIEATIVVEKDSQKAIVIGDKGQMVKQIGQAARYEMERFLGRKVFLKIWVKTIPNWKRDQAALRHLGYD